jgi:hypothetical protein
LKKENSFELTMHINSLYIHVKGILDNLASIINKRLPLEMGNQNNITLNHSQFKKCLSEKNKSLHDLIENELQKWLKDIKEKRDPIAHRKPLYVPPKKIEDETDLNKFNEINTNLNNEKNPEKIYSYIVEFQNQLTFHPEFIQYDNSKIDKIEETISCDMKYLYESYNKIMAEVLLVPDSACGNK